MEYGDQITVIEEVDGVVSDAELTDCEYVAYLAELDMITDLIDRICAAGDEPGPSV